MVISHTESNSMTLAVTTFTLGLLCAVTFDGQYIFKHCLQGHQVPATVYMRQREKLFTHMIPFCIFRFRYNILNNDVVKCVTRFMWGSWTESVYITKLVTIMFAYLFIIYIFVFTN